MFSYDLHINDTSCQTQEKQWQIGTQRSVAMLKGYQEEAHVWYSVVTTMMDNVGMRIRLQLICATSTSELRRHAEIIIKAIQVYMSYGHIIVIQYIFQTWSFESLLLFQSIISYNPIQKSTSNFFPLEDTADGISSTSAIQKRHQ